VSWRNVQHAVRIPEWLRGFAGSRGPYRQAPSRYGYTADDTPASGRGKACHLHLLAAVPRLMSVAPLPAQGKRARIEMEGHVE
jgi:hypothetical protein